MYDRRQLSYQQRKCIHNAFDDIMEYTIVCDDPLDSKEIVAEIEDEVEQTFGTPVSTGSIYQEKVFIAGNHDMCMYGAYHIEGLSKNVHYLYNNSVVIDGMKFYGVPMFMEDCMDGKLDMFIHNIPDDMDVLITHMPPKGICDIADYGKGLEHRGNVALAELLKVLHPTCHLYGHEHDAYGTTTIENVVYSNACVVDSRYNLINNPRLISLK